MASEDRAEDASGTTAAVVLAAGGASRFAGSDGPPGAKLVAPFRGRPLVAWAVEAALAAGLDETIVVTGAVELADVLAPVADRLTVLVNAAWAEGMAGSLAVARAAAERAGHAAI